MVFSMLAFWLLLAVISTNVLVTSTITAKDAWQRPGCHKVGKYFSAI